MNEFVPNAQSYDDDYTNVNENILYVLGIKTFSTVQKDHLLKLRCKMFLIPYLTSDPKT